MIYNSIISWAISTVGACCIDNLMNKPIDKFKNHFAKINKDDVLLDKQLVGIGILKNALIFGMMYRWITPWISTILAEKVWNKKHEKQSA